MEDKISNKTVKEQDEIHIIEKRKLTGLFTKKDAPFSYYFFLWRIKLTILKSWKKEWA